MSRNLVETVLGGAVVAVAVGFAWMATTTTQVDTGDGYEIQAAFLKIGGLEAGSDVRINGIKVGSVTGRDLDPETFDAVVSMTLRDDIRLPADTTASIVSAGLLGGKYVRLEPGTDRSNTLDSGGLIEKTRDFQTLEEQVGEIIFLATGGDEAGN